MCIALGGFFLPTIAVLLLSSSFLADLFKDMAYAFSVAGALTTSSRTWDMVFPRTFLCNCVIVSVIVLLSFWNPKYSPP